MSLFTIFRERIIYSNRERVKEREKERERKREIERERGSKR